MKFKVLGVTIELSFVLVAVFTLIVILDTSQRLICCFVSALLHEAGHIFIMCRLGKKPKKIICQLFNIKIIDNSRVFYSYKADLLVVLSGVIVNFILSIFSFIFFYISNMELLLTFSIVNLLTGLFNLLPVSNLDGGQAIYLILTQKFTEKTANRIIDVLTVLLIFPISIAGFIVLLNSKYNFSLLLISVYLIITLIIKNSKYF